jgi:Ca2+/H+ antiporter
MITARNMGSGMGTCVELHHFVAPVLVIVAIMTTLGCKHLSLRMVVLDARLARSSVVVAQTLDSQGAQSLDRPT